MMVGIPLIAALITIRNSRQATVDERLRLDNHIYLQMPFSFIVPFYV